MVEGRRPGRDHPRGGGADPHKVLTPEDLAREVAQDEEAGTPRKQAISDVAKRFNVPKRTVYDAVLAARDPGK